MLCVLFQKETGKCTCSSLCNRFPQTVNVGIQYQKLVQKHRICGEKQEVQNSDKEKDEETKTKRRGDKVV